MGVPLTPADVAALEARTEGWVAGLQLAALSLQDRPAASERFIAAFTGSHRFVVDYLVDEVLARQPAQVQLLAPHRDPGAAVRPAVRRGAGREPVGQGAQRARRVQPGCWRSWSAANLFVVAAGRERRWYRYHHLFAQVLAASVSRAMRQECTRRSRGAAPPAGEHWFAAPGPGGRGDPPRPGRRRLGPCGAAD